MSGANLEGATFHRAILRGANLSGANLKEANLNVAVLTSANLQRANLVQALLFQAEAGGADFTGANLSGALMGSASLSQQSCPSAGRSSTVRRTGLPCRAMSQRHTSSRAAEAEVSAEIRETANVRSSCICRLYRRSPRLFRLSSHKINPGCLATLTNHSTLQSGICRLLV